MPTTLKLLRRTCEPDGSGRYLFERSQWNTLTKELIVDDGGLTRCAYYSALTTTLIDGPYVIPASGYGYVAGHVGDTVRIYHDGAGGVTRVYFAGCDLSISTINTLGASASGAHNGSVAVDIATSASSATYRFFGPGLPVDGQLMSTDTLTGLGIGDYTVTVTDSNGCTAEGSFTIEVAPVYGCRNPTALNYNAAATAGADEDYCTFPPPPPRAPHFVLPAINPLHLLALRPAADGLTAFDTPLNQTTCAAVPTPAWARPPFALPVQVGDVHTIQWQSNYDSHAVEVINAATGVAVQSHTVNERLDLTALTDAFDGWIAPHPANPSQLRVYFNTPRLPQAFATGQAITLATGYAAMDGPALIADVQATPTAGALYLVVTRPWAGGGLRRITCSITSALAAQDFRVLESTVDFNTVAPGYYFVRLTAVGDGFDDVTVESERLYVALAHPATLVLEWRNYDNAFGVYYETGISHRMRVYSTWFRTKTGGARAVLRDSDNRMRLSGGAVWLLVEWHVERSPRWVHEQLAAALVHDLTLLNRYPVVCESGYPEPEYAARYTLASARVTLELQGAFGRGNGDDLGGPLPGAGDTGIAGISYGDGLIAYTTE